MSGCYFEFGTTTGYGQKMSCDPSDVGSGTSDVAVTAGSGKLKAKTTYHYRLVAKNVGGSRIGDDQTFTTAAAPSDSCPNAAVRAQQSAQFLPDCMSWEMVSPPQKFGQLASPLAISPDGTRVLLDSNGGFAGSPSVAGVSNSYLSSRNGAGWLTQPLNLPGTEFAIPGGSPGDVVDDLSRTIVAGQTLPQFDVGQSRFYFRGFDGSLAPASPVLQNQTVLKNGGVSDTDTPDFANYAGGAQNLSSFVFTTRGTSVLPGVDPHGTKGVYNLYEVTGALTDTPAVRRVDVDDTGSVVGALCAGRTLGGDGRMFHAVSADGSKIFFSAYATSPSGGTDGLACATKGPLRVMVRVNGSSTVEISKSQCDRVADPAATPPVTACNAPSDVTFEGASADGKSVFLTTAQQLTNDDTDATTDLYEYRFGTGGSAGTLTRISTAEGGAPDAAAAEQGVMRISDEGRRVYFVAQGRLTVDPNAAGKSPQANANNLYLFERTTADPGGHLVFVATLGAHDPYNPLWGGTDFRYAQLADADGQILVFNSAARLTSDDTDDAIDVFRYDADTGVMQRLSQATSGYGSNGNAELPARIGGAGYSNASLIGRQMHQVSADGHAVVFVTDEALAPGDVNGLDDVYIWRGGHVGLVTDGRGPEAGIRQDKGQGIISADGNSVTFQTAQPLLSQDGDDSVDTYVARVDGGFLSTLEPDTSCVGEACQGEETAPPALPGPLTKAFVGPGNVAPPLVPKAPRTKPKVSKVKTVHGTSTRIRVKVPGKGKIRITGSGLTRSSKTAKKAGTYKVKVKLSKRARRTLKRKHRVKVRMTVRFVPAQGKASSVRAHVTFRPKKAKKRHRGSSSRSVRRVTVLFPDARKGR